MSSTHKRLTPTMEKKEINEKFPAIDFQPVLTSDEREHPAHL
jgi:hypothetical protein